METKTHINNGKIVLFVCLLFILGAFFNVYSEELPAPETEDVKETLGDDNATTTQSEPDITPAVAADTTVVDLATTTDSIIADTATAVSIADVDLVTATSTLIVDSAAATSTVTTDDIAVATSTSLFSEENPDSEEELKKAAEEKERREKEEKEEKWIQGRGVLYPDLRDGRIKHDVQSDGVRAVIVEVGGMQELWYTPPNTSATEETAWNKLAGDSLIDNESTLGMFGRTIFWFDKNKQTLYGFSVDEESLFGKSLEGDLGPLFNLFE
ncbi:MAG: hypothetical protein HYT40_01355 [Candidatus Sungbacteria bacterium]|uniref:Uncharacterized protein n=1 Tax=Candidatus Sungiibacteriota bacterium TaxID=2750080 RepID=A0A931SB68_9BACT|nr:hypothetical protein [Candidatus Sungbacteria bacterium]